MVMTRVVGLVAAGAGIGILASLWLSHVIAAMLYGVPPRDPLTLGAASIVLMAVAVVAGWLPAYRAARTDPATVLRNS